MLSQMWRINEEKKKKRVEVLCLRHESIFGGREGGEARSRKRTWFFVVGRVGLGRLRTDVKFTR